MARCCNRLSFLAVCHNSFRITQSEGEPMGLMATLGEKASFSLICFKLQSGTIAIASIHTKKSEGTNSETYITVLMGGLGRFPQARWKASKPG